MDRVHHELCLADRLRDQGARLDANRLVAVVDGMSDNGVIHRPHLARDVLDERTAQGHVHDLKTTADGERREASVGGDVSKLDLELVPVEVGAPHGVVAVGSIALRLDVAATAEHETVDEVGDRRHVRVGNR